MKKEQFMSEIILVCAWCEQVKVDDEWINKMVEHKPNVSHGICPKCLEVERNKLKQFEDVIKSFLDKEIGHEN